MRLESVLTQHYAVNPGLPSATVRVKGANSAVVAWISEF
jgi:hypothetical protein